MGKDDMGKKINILEQKFGKLTVVKEGTRRKGSGYPARWVCKCDCGNMTEVDSWHLRNGVIKTCGCSKKSKLGEGEAGLNRIIRTYKRHAKTLNRIYELTKDEVRILTKSNCFYCGIQPQQIVKEKGGIYVYNGIDRVDNNKGYCISNVVSCCMTCNRMKRNMTQEQFLLQIGRIYANKINGKSTETVTGYSGFCSNSWK